MTRADLSLFISGQAYTREGAWTAKRAAFELLNYVDELTDMQVTTLLKVFQEHVEGIDELDASTRKFISRLHNRRPDVLSPQIQAYLSFASERHERRSSTAYALFRDHYARLGLLHQLDLPKPNVVELPSQRSSVSDHTVLSLDPREVIHEQKTVMYPDGTFGPLRYYKGNHRDD